MALNNKSHEEGEKLVVVLDQNTVSSNKQGTVKIGTLDFAVFSLIIKKSPISCMKEKAIMVWA